MRRIKILIAILLSACVLLSCTACIPATPPDTIPSSIPSQATPPTAIPSSNPELSDSNSEYFISRFLTDINFNGKIASSGETIAPGILPDVSQIPKADQAPIGSNVLISLDSTQTPVAFLYHLDTSTGAERFAAVISCDNIPMLIVFQPELGSVSALCEALSTGNPFSTTVLSMTNISYEESMYAFSASENRGENEIDFNAPPENDGNDVWLVGYLGMRDGQSYTALFTANANALEIYERIFSRFSIDFEVA